MQFCLLLKSSSYGKGLLANKKMIREQNYLYSFQSHQNVPINLCLLAMYPLSNHGLPSRSLKAQMGFIMAPANRLLLL